MPDSIKNLKTFKCPSLSGKSTLTYHLGCDEEQKVYVRIYNNTGNGFFSKEWVSLDLINEALKNAAEPITSIALFKLFKRQSVNTPSFLLAALKNEKLVQPIKGKQRCHELSDSKPFLEKVQKLISPTAKPRIVRKKAPVKKKAASSRKRAAKTV